MLDRLREYFTGRDDVAFLFGSRAGGEARPDSDVDVAVYFYPKRRRLIEFEEEVCHEGEDEILVVLNRVPAAVADSAIRGKPIITKDPGLYIDFMLVVTSEVIDFREMVKRDFLERLRHERGAESEADKAPQILKWRNGWRTWLTPRSIWPKTYRAIVAALASVRGFDRDNAERLARCEMELNKTLHRRGGGGLR